MLAAALAEIDTKSARVKAAYRNGDLDAGGIRRGAGHHPEGAGGAGGPGWPRYREGGGARRVGGERGNRPCRSAATYRDQDRQPEPHRR